ncbi:CAMK/CAMK1 protein kinase [Allomyces macrogynus ATCC 38327]|uniref:CAMK/CAMK1 protein kinase n=1 Tax=Allomyces macrogynus (strain ATCC 38327) TaxID=578462 RepID=A0A0L0SD73_ALLM3|nr:CAMK/CAMK1 protein kinase [Allomyces macrogynus ATCC 38327]|eukprot:KNE60468.1 CAMK/CAMK1 protein kinase [Allomyces macrogynus ATCC 38327]
MPPVVPPASPSGATSPAPNVLDLGMSLTIEMLYAKFDIGDVIGTGAFSEVRRATERATGVRFAVKIIDKAKCRGKESMIQSEVEILKRVKHRNIIRLFEMYESPLKIFLVMELVTGGELFDRIVERGHYTESDAAKIVYEILRGVQYLHRLNICHRDLKPENLLFYDATPDSRIMISDFGLSKIFDDVQLMRTACGTPGYVAPEVLRREGYQKQVDMWSIGVITYILLCGYPPFYEENNHALLPANHCRGTTSFDSPYWDNNFV